MGGSDLKEDRKLVRKEVYMLEISVLSLEAWHLWSPPSVGQTH